MTGWGKKGSVRECGLREGDAVVGSGSDEGDDVNDDGTEAVEEGDGDNAGVRGSAGG